MPSEFQSFSQLLRFFDENKAQYALARSVADIKRAKQEGKISQLYGWQSAEALGNDFNNPLGSPETPLRAYYEMGLRILGIAYNVTNVFGGGCLEPRIGLTRAGRRLVEEIHSLRILLDIGGHTGEQASFDALELSRGVPVICSHTNVAAIADNPRCISDRLIEAIAATGGVIGITAVSDFMKRSRNDAKVPRSVLATLDDYLSQLDYVRKLVGASHVGLGPDFIDGIPLNFAAFNHEILPPDMISEGPWRYADGFDTISKLPAVTGGLIERGWSSDEIRQVLGENWLRVYQQAWGA